MLIVGDKPKEVCGNCGTLFPLTRQDRIYCGQSCQRTAHNHPKTGTTGAPPGAHGDGDGAAHDGRDLRDEEESCTFFY